jgi:hypothetical protein
LEDSSVLKELAEPPSQPLDANAALNELRSLSNAVIDEYDRLLVKYPHPTQMQS